MNAQQAAGATQRGIEEEGIAADYAQFKEERDFPYKQVQYQQSLLQGLPISAEEKEYIGPSSTSDILSQLGFLKNVLYDENGKLIDIPDWIKNLFNPR